MLLHLGHQPLPHTLEQLHGNHLFLAVNIFDEVEIAVAATWITHLGDLAVHPHVAKLAHQHHVDVVDQLRDTPGCFIELAVLVAKGFVKGLVEVGHVM